MQNRAGSAPQSGHDNKPLDTVAESSAGCCCVDEVVILSSFPRRSAGGPLELPMIVYVFALQNVMSLPADITTINIVS